MRANPASSGHPSHADRPAAPALAVALAITFGFAFTFAIGPARAGAGDIALELTEVAPGVLVHYGAVALNSPGNHGDIANLGAIVGERCVAIVDTGGSPAVGAALRRAVAKHTSRPICHVINTHGHPDHILGNAAFVDDRPDFIGHARLATAMAARGAGYQRAARADLGPEAGEPTLVPPTRAVQDRLVLDLGGRELDVQAWPPAHTDQDLTVTDLATGVIFTGDLAFDQHLPVLDGNLKGWLLTLDRLRALPVKLAIPGHGRPAAMATLLAPQQRYLEDLRTRISAAIANRQPLAPTVETLGKAPGPADSTVRWSLTEQFHRRNVTAAYAELEWD